MREAQVGGIGRAVEDAPHDAVGRLQPDRLAMIFVLSQSRHTSL